MSKVRCKEWDLEDRRNAAVMFAQLGSWSMVSQKMGIPRTTLQNWEKDNEFQATLGACRQAITSEHIQRHLNLVTKAQEEALDRLTNGDALMTKDGEIRRIPMKGKDVAVVMAIAQDKAQILQMKPTSISATDDRLLKLAERLGQIARQQEARTVEGEVINKGEGS